MDEIKRTDEPRGEHGHFAPGNSGSNRSGLSTKIHKAIVEAIRGSNFHTTAARAAGVHPRTLRRWLREGEADDQAKKKSRKARRNAMPPR